MSAPQTQQKRARPQLGTIVEIEASHAQPEQAQQAIGAAFAAIQRVDELMSPQRGDSDIARINCAAAGARIQVDEQTMQVLTFCDRLFVASDGLFDPVTLAGQASWRDLHLEADAVAIRHPLTLDLGGVAKGFAVDQAVAVLEQHGCDSGMVNAGGDLRCFGQSPRSVHVRNPEQPAQLLLLANLQNRALATSARLSTMEMTPHLPVRTGVQEQQWRGSVSVMAADCMTADALTKFVIACGRTDHPLLADFNAHAIWIGQA